MAWLDRPAANADVKAEDFISWIEKYLLPSNPILSAADMYGARCGLLHSHTGESKRHREFKVRKIFYTRQIGGEEYSIRQLRRLKEKFLPPTVDLDAFVGHFKKAVQKFRDDFANDPPRRDRIHERVSASYLPVARRAK